jgi:HK97 family phage major capsid protein
MSNTLELIDKREQLKIKAEAILSSAEKETRKLNDEEQNEFVSIKNQITEVDNEIRKMNEELNKQTNNKKEKRMEKFSLLKAVREVANNQPLDERSQEVINQGIAEMRKAGQNYSGQIILPVEERADIQATVDGAGQEVVAEDKLNILAPLYDKLVLTQAGATYMTGLVGNISIPTYTGTSAAWAGEVDAAADGAGTFGEVNLEPKRLTTKIDISKQFLIQDSVSAEQMLRQDIVNAIKNKLEATILGSAAGSATQPAGIFNGATAATLTYDGTVDMEKALEDNKIYGEKCYIVSPAIKATLRKAKVDAGSGRFVLEGNEINGIKTLSTGNSAGIVLGDFSEYVIGQWGGIDLTVDPFTQAANGKVRLVINAYFDAKPRRATAFVAGTAE